MRAGVLIVALISILACERRSERGEQPAPQSAKVSCVGETPGKIVVTDDSVGRFAIASATMGEVAASCAAADTAYESLCCYMALLVHLRMPGVVVQAEQNETPNESHEQIVPAATVRTFDVSGDGVVLRDGLPLQASVADLVRRFGTGYAENPNYDDNDGPELHLCAFRNLSFRIAPPGSTLGTVWLADTSARNRSIPVQGVVAMKRSDEGKRYCLRMVDSLASRE